MERVFEYNAGALRVTFGGKVTQIYFSGDLLRSMRFEDLMIILASQLNGIFAQHDLSVSEAAELLSIHPSTLRLWEKNGRVKSIRTIGEHRRYSVESIHKLLKERESV